MSDLACATEQSALFRKVASTDQEFLYTSVRQKTSIISDPLAQYERSNLFREAQFSSDGTTVVTQNEDQCLRSFILPVDLLDDSVAPHTLRPYSTFQSPSNVQSYAIYPRFNLHDYASTLVVCGGSDVPLTLRNALDLSTVRGSYLFVNDKTEVHRSARCILFSKDSNHIIAGGDNVIAIFDCHRDGSGPLMQHVLRSARRALQVDTWSFSHKAFASSLSSSPDGYLAVGTTQREIGLYERDGMGQCATTFALAAGLGTGVTGLKWSPCGRYLLIVERQSDIVHVYDVRNTLQRVSSLTGRRGKTPQRLGIDVLHADGYQVWGGNTDGALRMWSNPGSQGEIQEPALNLPIHCSPISSVVWHPTGAVLATCSGERLSKSGLSSGSDSDSNDGKSGDNKIPDNSLKIWDFQTTSPAT